MNEYMFTIGFGQYDGRFNNCYFVVKAENEGDARIDVLSKIGSKWAFSYTMDNEAKLIIQEHDMVLVTLEEVAKVHLELYPNDYPHNRPPVDVF